MEDYLEIDFLAEKVAVAISDVFNFDMFLLENNVHEVAINHRIAIYLERELRKHELYQNCFVDIEYNRLNKPLNSKPIPECKELIFRPDIIVHNRDRKMFLLWLEIKIAEDEYACRSDENKVCHACKNFDFLFGFSVLINYKKRMLSIRGYSKIFPEIYSTYEFSYQMKNRRFELFFKEEELTMREPLYLIELKKT